MPVSADREELFELRVERRRRDLVEALETLYGHDAALPLADRLVGLAHDAFSSVRTTCTSSTSGVPFSRTGSSCPRMVGYAAYTERFAENLKGSRRRSRTCASWA